MRMLRALPALAIGGALGAAPADVIVDGAPFVFAGVDTAVA